MDKRTSAQVVAAIGSEVREHLRSSFTQAGVAYPPDKVTLLAIKDSAVMELWAGPKTEPVFIRPFAIKAASGVAGPKLWEGDKQVPEGLYQVTGLNPNSKFHLSMKLNYPNEFDQFHAAAEQRLTPGSDIFIHGKSKSVGCLAVGDAAIEALYGLAFDVGIQNISVMIAPTDPREGPLDFRGHAAWVESLYASIEQEFGYYRKPEA